MIVTVAAVVTLAISNLAIEQPVEGAEARHAHALVLVWLVTDIEEKRDPSRSATPCQACLCVVLHRRLLTTSSSSPGLLRPGPRCP